MWIQKKARFITPIVFLFLFTSCNNKLKITHKGSINKPIVSVSMYNSSSFPAWRSYVEKVCPNIHIVWNDNRNSFSNVIYMAKHGEVPDIIAIRRFENDKARELEPYLSDLNSLDITQSFIPEYIEPFSNSGKQYWLPEPFLVEGMFANKNLFDHCGIPLPTDLNSFISACKNFEKYNFTVCGFDSMQGWTNTAIVEGFGAASVACEENKKLNMKSFFSGNVNKIDDGTGKAIVDTLRLLKNNHIITNEDLTMDTYTLTNKTMDGTVAVYKAGTDEKRIPADKYEYVILPFFGKTQQENILYTYPVFSLALSNNCTKNSTHRNECVQVMKAMLDVNAQNLLNQNSEGLISPCKDITLAMSSSMDFVKSLIDEHRCFVRLLNEHTFEACTALLNAIIVNDVDDKEAIDLLNQIMSQNKSDEYIGTSNVEAQNIRDLDCNSPSAGVLANMLQNQMGVDCAIIDSRESAAPLFKGPYTSTDIASVLLDGPVYKASLSDKELSSLLDAMIIYTTTFLPGGSEPLVDYPSLSGLTISMTCDGTIVSSLKPGTYKVAVSSKIYNSLVSTSNNLATLFNKQTNTLGQYITREFIARGVPAPHVYFKVIR